MFNFKLIIGTVLIASVLQVYGYPEPDDMDPCLIQRKCSTIEEIVWATDDRQCYVFRNKCIYTNDMCQRRKENKTDLQLVTRTECKEKCSNFCTEEYFPVCAEHDNALETFSNKCEFLRTSCQYEKSYIFLHDGKCDEPAAA